MLGGLHAFKSGLVADDNDVTRADVDDHGDGVLVVTLQNDSVRHGNGMIRMGANPPNLHGCSGDTRTGDFESDAGVGLAGFANCGVHVVG